MFSLYSWLREGKDLFLLEWIGTLLLCLGVALALMAALTSLRIPYGRYGSDGGLFAKLRLTSCKIPARLGWFLQELPAFCVPMYLILNVGGRYVGELNPNIMLLGMFILHYFNRTFIYSFSVKGNHTPVTPMILAMSFCTLNGYMQGRYLTHFIHYDMSWFFDARFLVGHILFLLGMALNIHADSTLRGLRKPGETGYKIPYGGMFEYVSGANYFGECVEWTGYAIACWSWPGTVFAIFSILFLGSRAVHHHRFYLVKFEDYPKNRKAFIPFLL